MQGPANLLLPGAGEGTCAIPRPLRRPRAAALAMALLACAPPLLAGGPYEGRAHVVDGSTLRFEDQQVRLWGVEAPDARQLCQLDGKPWACGEDARAALADYVAQRKVRCEVVDQAQSADRHARCRVGSTDLNHWVVQQGWALDYEAQGGRTYGHSESRAALERRGLWQGQFVEPWEWRAVSAPRE